MRRSREQPQKTPTSTAAGFFDDYPEFYSTSHTYPVPTRLNLRYQAIFDLHRDLYHDAHVLDLACDDGRWSLAALESGARRVTGIEARPELLAPAQATLQSYGYGADRFEPIQGDLFAVLAKQAFEVDVVLCLGFLYHTLRYPELLHRIREACPEYVIVDTDTARGSGAKIQVTVETVAKQGNAISDEYAPGDCVLSGRPTPSGLNQMMSAYGFAEHAKVDWTELIARSPSAVGVGDYASGRRVTRVFRRTK